ncbi:MULTISPECIES: VacJ family lipoprotein [Thiomicrorhabdus]|uniref:MlaA family lipoprotein n=1 Tax=Thiomicrorhabdus TaxID=2039723 RepID=UPI001E4161D9|nr:MULTISPECIES: VacJ family lipoprotein [Thiomicrorhabdus]
MSALFLLSSSVLAKDVDPLAELPTEKPIDVINGQDPYESFNRDMFEFNMSFDENVGQPMAQAYNFYVPSPVRQGIDNFFNNLAVPLSSVNSFLQGNFEDGFSGIMRFVINSTFGLFGILDIATPAGLEDKKEDFGQTMAKWGLWQQSNYLVLPIIGPYTTRELVGGSVDSLYNPVYPYLIEANDYGKLAIFAVDKFIDYAAVSKLFDELKTQPDPYIFARESYIQYRTNLIYDGHPPRPSLDDFNFD